MSLEDAFVTIQPQVDSDEFVSSLDQSMSAVEQRAEDATSNMEDSFGTAADGASDALDSIDPDFSGVTDAADAAGSGVEQTFDSVDSDFSAATASADAAGEAVEDAFSSAAEAADVALSEVDADGFEGVAADADEAGSAVSEAFQTASDEAQSALDIDADFSQVADAATSVADDLVSTMEDGASASSDALADVDADFSAAVDAAEGAATEIESSMSVAADSSSADLSSTEPDFGALEAAAAGAAGSVVSSFDDVGDSIEEEMEQSGEAVSSLQSQVAGLIGAIIGLAVFRQAALDAEAFNSAVGATDQILEQTSFRAGLLTSDLEAMADRSQVTFGVDTTEMLQAQNVLLTFGNITDEVFERTLVAAQDVATVMGTDLRRGLIQMGRAVDDPTEGLTALTRVGITFTDEQEEMIRTLQESGNILEAQNIILGEVEESFGGVAAATADSTAIIGSSLADVRRDLGQPIIEIIDENLDSILRIVDSLIPAAESLGVVFGATLELLIAAEPLIVAVAEGIAAIPDPVLAMAAAFFVGNRALSVGVPLLRRMSLLRFAGVAASIAALSVAFQTFDQGVEGLDTGVSSADQALRDLSSGVDNELIDSLRQGNQWLEDSVDVLGLANVNLSTLDEGARRAANEFESSMESIDQALVNTLAQGGLPQAKEQVQLLADELGIGADELDAWTSDHLPDYSDALIRAELEAEATKNAIEEFGAATENVGQELTDFDTDPTAQGFIDLAGALQESENQAADFDVVAQDLGTDLENLQTNVVPGMLAEFEGFAASLQSSIPGLSEVVSGAFERMDEEQENLTFSDVRASLFDTLEDARQFSTDVQLLVDSGLTEMARLAIEGGPEVAAALVSGPQGAQEDMEIALQELSTIVQEQTLQTAADAAIVSFFVGQALRDGTLDGVEALPEDVRGVIEEAVGVYVERDPTPEVETFGGRAEDAINRSLNNTVGDVRNAFHDRFPSTVEAANPFIDEKAAAYGTAAENAVQRGLNPLLGEVQETFGVELPEQVSRNRGRGSGAGRGVGRSIGGGVTEGINDRRSRVAAAAGGAVDAAASNARGRADNAGFFGIGTGMASGISSGMSSSFALGAIIASAVSLVNAALRAARNAAGISSPSRLFHDAIGAEIPAGIAGGILDGEVDVVEATRQVLDSAAAVEAAVPRFGRGAVGGSAGGLDDASLQRLAQLLGEVMPRTLLLQAGSEQALARIVSTGDEQLRRRDPNWRRGDDLD